MAKKMGIERLMGILKSKIVRSFKATAKTRKSSGSCSSASTNNYGKMEKSESMKIEMQSRRARQLIEKTLKVADSPTSKSISI